MFIKKFNKNKSDYFDIYNIKINLFCNLRALRINSYSQINMIILPPLLDTIIIENLFDGYDNLNKLNVKNLHIINFNCSYDNFTMLKDLGNIENLYLYNNSLSYATPKNIKKIYCKNLFIKSIYLDYLECIYMRLSEHSYIKTIKLQPSNESYSHISIPKCDKLLIDKNNNIIIEYLCEKPSIIEYY